MQETRLGMKGTAFSAFELRMTRMTQMYTTGILKGLKLEFLRKQAVCVRLDPYYYPSSSFFSARFYSDSLENPSLTATKQE